jgi:hypothetical protein
MENIDLKPALLFIPDISGFTQFVRDTEISHSQHIIKELLETLIEANNTGLQVSEVEGDAILFFKFGQPPTVEELFQQVQKMFVSFHSQIKLHESQRICQCKACSTSHNLTLKFVAHYGNITQTQIKEHTKLFGQDVIAIHRLLKNDISHHEYVLFTDSLINDWQNLVLPHWAKKSEGRMEYDVGIINYNYVQLSPLKQLIPEPEAEDFSIPGIKLPVFNFVEEINCSLDLLFDVLSDHSLRLQWMQGAKEIVYFGHQLNHVGTKHRCVISKDSPVMVTSEFSRDLDKITFAETDENKKMCSVYTLSKKNESQTDLRVDGFIKNDFLLKMIFKLLLKKKISTLFQASIKNLKIYCEDLYIKQQV